MTCRDLHGRKSKKGGIFVYRELFHLADSRNILTQHCKATVLQQKINLKKKSEPPKVPRRQPLGGTPLNFSRAVWLGLDCYVRKK